MLFRKIGLGVHDQRRPDNIPAIMLHSTREDKIKKRGRQLRGGSYGRTPWDRAFLFQITGKKVKQEARSQESEARRRPAYLGIGHQALGIRKSKPQRAQRNAHKGHGGSLMLASRLPDFRTLASRSSLLASLLTPYSWLLTTNF